MASSVDLNLSLLDVYFSRTRLRDNFQRLCNSIKPDVTLKLSDGELKAHNFVLSLSSKYFERAFNGVFAEGNTHTIDLTDSPVRTEVIRQLVKMFYMHPYPYTSVPTADTEPKPDYKKMRLNLEMYHAAQCFAADDVMSLAKDGFGSLVGRINQPDGAIGLLSLVETMYDDQVTAQEMRNILLAKLSKYAKSIKRARADELKDLLDRFPDFATDFTLQMCDEKPEIGDTEFTRTYRDRLLMRYALREGGALPTQLSAE